MKRGAHPGHADAATRAAGEVAPSPVSLREMAPGDVDLTYEWQCHPETRRYFRNPATPSRHEHERWFAGALADPHCHAYVILEDGRPVGTVRLNRCPQRTPDAGEAFEVSLVVAPRLHGQGLGRAALARVREAHARARLVADIHPGNLASQHVFLACGYRRIDPRTYVQEPAEQESSDEQPSA